MPDRDGLGHPGFLVLLPQLVTHLPIGLDDLGQARLFRQLRRELRHLHLRPRSQLFQAPGARVERGQMAPYGADQLLFCTGDQLALALHVGVRSRVPEGAGRQRVERRPVAQELLVHLRDDGVLRDPRRRDQAAEDLPPFLTGRAVQLLQEFPEHAAVRVELFAPDVQEQTVLLLRGKLLPRVVRLRLVPERGELPLRFREARLGLGELFLEEDASPASALLREIRIERLVPTHQRVHDALGGGRIGVIEGDVHDVGLAPRRDLQVGQQAVRRPLARGHEPGGAALGRLPAEDEAHAFDLERLTVDPGSLGPLRAHRKPIPGVLEPQGVRGRPRCDPHGIEQARLRARMLGSEPESHRVDDLSNECATADQLHLRGQHIDVAVGLPRGRFDSARHGLTDLADPEHRRRAIMGHLVEYPCSRRGQPQHRGTAYEPPSPAHHIHHLGEGDGIGRVGVSRVTPASAGVAR